MKASMQLSTVALLLVFSSSNCFDNSLGGGGGDGGVVPITALRLVDYHPTWSVNDVIAYVHRPESPEDYARGLEQIWVIKPDGTDHRYVTHGTLPDWSPDGELLTISRDDEILVVDMDGNVVSTIPTPSDAYFPDWGPSGERISFHVTKPIESAGTWIVNLDGTALRQVYSLGRGPDWHPSGQLLIVSSFEPPEETFTELYTVNISSGSTVRMTQNHDQEKDPEWSRDGSRIVYSRQIGGSDFEVFVMNSDGGGQTQLTTESGEYPCWSPDDSRVAYVKYRAFESVEGNGRIWVMSVDGSSNRQLTGVSTQESSDPEQ